MESKNQENKLFNIEEYNNKLKNMSSLEIIESAYKEFDKGLAFTTSFGIQSSVLLHLIRNSKLRNEVKIFWIDTGYLPSETYKYANKLMKLLSLKIEILQSDISPAHMEAIYGKLWEGNNAMDIDKYHKLRKIDPLEHALQKYSIKCWGSGVRSQQTSNRKNMSYVDLIRGRISLRPLLGWSNKDIYYYMKENNLPQHPLFNKGYSTVGDWHSSSPESDSKKGRKTRFNGIKEECGLHINN
tara:strand:- start:7047 stop:7769 length:723 start_codon:yes stop_codon:yes gene_type:complete